MTEAQVPKGASDEMGYYARIEQFVSAEIPRELYIRSVIPRNEALPKSQILRFTEKAIQLARRLSPDTPQSSPNTAIHFLVLLEASL